MAYLYFPVGITFARKTKHCLVTASAALDVKLHCNPFQKYLKYIKNVLSL